MWQIRQMMALAVLAVCAYTDIKERNVYLIPLLVSVVGSEAVLAISVIGTSGPEAYPVLMNDMLMPFVTGLAVIALTRVFKAHIGVGDGYLMAALGMMTGIKTMIFSIPIAFITAGLYALIKTVPKRRRSTRTIPFAPFVLTGFMAVLINEI